MANLTESLNGLGKVLNPDFIRTDQTCIHKYTLEHLSPKAVIFPSSTEQVAGVVKFANQANLSILPWGNGSKITTGYPPDRLDLVVCTSRLNHMLDVDTENLTITVEAGVKHRDIQARLATEDDRCYLPLRHLETERGEVICSDRSHRGCFLPIDPPWSGRATIGGILAANSSGPRRLLYGLPRDIVLGVRFVTPDGEIVGAGGKTVKNVSGYDISKFMIGSMGTLGILCEVTLRLLPLPECMETLLISFGSLSDSADFVDHVLETQLLPAAIEVMNDRAYKNLSLPSAPLMDAGDYVVAVALETFEEPVVRMGRELGDMARNMKAKLNTRIQEKEHLRFWLAVGNLALPGFDPSSGPMMIQLNFPVSKWHAIAAASVEILDSLGLHHTLLVHAGSGLALVNLAARNHGDTTWTTKALQAADALLKICREQGGNLIFQTTPVDLKEKLPIWGEPRRDWPVMRRIKERMDPARLMSPGRFIGGL